MDSIFFSLEFYMRAQQEKQNQIASASNESRK